MQTNCTYIPYHATGYFSKLVLDYLQESPNLKQFYQHTVSLDGIKAAIKQREATPHHRQLLVTELRNQYLEIQLTASQEKSLNNLLLENTFTICTAHQPNIFTGHLYFIYKILHAVKLAETLSKQLPGYNFVPVFYMGSEDADLDELGHINLNGERIEWKTKQTGAVGRMVVDAGFIDLIDQISGQLSIHNFGKELISLFKKCYTLGTSIQQATLLLVNELFKDFGLLILIPDNANLKRPFNSIIKKELTEQFSYPLVKTTADALNANYKVQAAGRNINLFYLADNLRERITENADKFQVSSFEWTKEEMLQEIDEHPERFSCNVILRGVFQETILPNVAFIGGGGEIAYWLELKKVFEACNVPFPVLVLRNSFLLIDKHQKSIIEKFGFTDEDLFKTERELLGQLVNRDTKLKLSVDDELAELHQFYAKLRKNAEAIDATLSDHVANLERQAEKKLVALEKKMCAAEMKKYGVEMRQLKKFKDILFPDNNLQERIENFSVYYSKYGERWIKELYKSSLSLEQQFSVLYY